jgi:hypothetical protein
MLITETDIPIRSTYRPHAIRINNIFLQPMTEPGYIGDTRFLGREMPSLVGVTITSIKIQEIYKLQAYNT